MTSFKIQVIAIAENGQEEAHEITSLARSELTPEMLGLSLAEGKAILRDIQQIVINGCCRAVPET